MFYEKQTEDYKKKLTKVIYLLAKGKSLRYIEAFMSGDRSTISRVLRGDYKKPITKEYLLTIKKYVLSNKPTYDTFYKKYGYKGGSALLSLRKIDASSTEEAQIKEIHKLRSTGLSYYAIGKLMNISWGTVRRIYLSRDDNNKISNTQKVASAKTAAKIRKMYDTDKYSINDIASIMGMGNTNVRYTLTKNYGYRFAKDAKLTPKQILRLVKLRDEAKLSFRELGYIFGIEPSLLNYHYIKHHIIGGQLNEHKQEGSKFAEHYNTANN